MGRSWEQQWNIFYQKRSAKWDASWHRFLVILVGFGRQVGVENRAKSEHKSIEKRIEKIMKKTCVLEASRGGEQEALHGEAGILGPSNLAYLAYLA